MKIPIFLLFCIFINCKNKIYFVLNIVNQDLEDPVSLASVQNIIDEGTDELSPKNHMIPAKFEDNDNTNDQEESLLINDNRCYWLYK